MNKIIDFNQVETKKRNYCEIYQRFSVYSTEKEVLKSVINGILGNTQLSHILDVGSGDGKLLSGLSANVSSHTKAMAIEPNNFFHRHILQNNPHLDKLEIVGHPIQNVVNNVNPSTFDLILCSHMLYHLSDSEIEVLIPRLLKILKPEGRIIVVLNDVGSHSPNSYPEYFDRFHNPTAISKVGLRSAPSPSMVAKLLRKHHIQVSEKVIFPSIIVSSEDFDIFLRLCLAFLSQPIKTLAEKMTEIKNYLQQCRDSENNYRLLMPQVVLIGVVEVAGVEPASGKIP